MRVAVVGSRDYPKLHEVKEYIATLGRGDVIITGGARGVDRMAEACAKERQLSVVVHYPDWNKYGKAAGPIRNEIIVKDCDILVAFWDGTSRGTANAIQLAKAAGKFASRVKAS